MISKSLDAKGAQCFADDTPTASHPDPSSETGATYVGIGSAIATLERRLSGDLDALGDFAEEISGLERSLPGRINADQAEVEHGLAKLVLTLIELIRRLLEKQAIRRIEAGSVTEDQIERMGETFVKLEQKMAELKVAFGLEGEDLNINLGPLGNLM